ncbi:hypothetical protein C9Y97_15640 [Escherichia coli]|nr:hypothetical protein C9Y97_15640 [Escherichia coli]
MRVIFAHFRLTGTMSGFSVCFLRMSGSLKACFYIFHIVNLKRNRTWIPKNFHKQIKNARSPPRNGP